MIAPWLAISAAVRPVERVERDCGELRAPERRIRRDTDRSAQRAASGSERTATRRARTTAPSPSARACAPRRRLRAVTLVDAQVQIELRGRRQFALHVLAVQLDDRDLLGPQILERGAGRGDRHEVIGAPADVSSRPATSPSAATRRAAAATCSRSRSSIGRSLSGRGRVADQTIGRPIAPRLPRALGKEADPTPKWVWMYVQSGALRPSFCRTFFTKTSTDRSFARIGRFQTRS